MVSRLAHKAFPFPIAESWQNGYCTGLENRRPKGHGGSNPSLSVTFSLSYLDVFNSLRWGSLVEIALGYLLGEDSIPKLEKLDLLFSAIVVI